MNVLLEWIKIQKCQYLSSCIIRPKWCNNFLLYRTSIPEIFLSFTKKKIHHNYIIITLFLFFNLILIVQIFNFTKIFLDRYKRNKRHLHSSKLENRLFLLIFRRDILIQLAFHSRNFRLIGSIFRSWPELLLLVRVGRLLLSNGRLFRCRE